MGRWGDGEMGRWGVRWFNNIPYCLLPIACCLLPVACCLLPVASCLLPIASCPHNSHTPPVP
ncbi:hypothetical protein [Moorena producens]|uniref:hypothetical protein n=1 Tax=Moorena producens TaxID=1155739 RepID=UPI003C75A627